ncbi:MAG: isoprenylcysteine carboxylmethyltransferase family protein [Bryobacteraceae bacterium]|nr:isoprenylcysteine carboxylmethyltransferase family protein [Bryobacteraceae bacterium]
MSEAPAGIARTANWIIAGCWILYVALTVLQWIRIRAARRRHGEAWEGRLSDPASRKGLYLQGAIFLVFVPGPERPAPLLWAGIILAPLSLLLTWLAFKHLGDQWRISAVVTADHRLVTSGPYAVIRHPIYTALFCLLLATGFVIGRLTLTLVAAGVFALGTEIRIRAEERLLAARFGDEHAKYRARTKAWIPLVR